MVLNAKSMLIKDRGTKESEGQKKKAAQRRPCRLMENGGSMGIKGGKKGRALRGKQEGAAYLTVTLKSVLARRSKELGVVRGLLPVRLRTVFCLERR